MKEGEREKEMLRSASRKRKREDVSQHPRDQELVSAKKAPFASFSFPLSTVLLFYRHCESTLHPLNPPTLRHTRHMSSQFA